MIRKKRLKMSDESLRNEHRKQRLKRDLHSMHFKHKERDDDKYTRDELLSKTIFEIEIICEVLGINHNNTEKMYRPPTPPKGAIIYKRYTMEQLPPKYRKMKIEYEYAISLINEILEYQTEEKGDME